MWQARHEARHDASTARRSAHSAVQRSAAQHAWRQPAPDSSSVRMQPTLQMSQGKDQPRPRMTSGALRTRGRKRGEGRGSAGERSASCCCLAAREEKHRQARRAAGTQHERRRAPVVPRGDDGRVVVGLKGGAAEVDHPDVGGERQPLAHPGEKRGVGGVGGQHGGRQAEHARRGAGARHGRDSRMAPSHLLPAGGASREMSWFSTRMFSVEGGQREERAGGLVSRASHRAQHTAPALETRAERAAQHHPAWAKTHPA